MSVTIAEFMKFVTTTAGAASTAHCHEHFHHDRHQHGRRGHDGLTTGSATPLLLLLLLPRLPSRGRLLQYWLSFIYNTSTTARDTLPFDAFLQYNHLAQPMSIGSRVLRAPRGPVHQRAQPASRRDLFTQEETFSPLNPGAKIRLYGSGRCIVWVWEFRV